MHSFTRFKGIRNTVDPQRLRPDEWAAGVNVDLDDEERASRRPGRELASSGACDSLYTDGQTTLFRRSGTLRRLNGDGSVTDLGAAVARVTACYGDGRGRIYYSDGIACGIVENGAARRWGIVPPATLPTVSVVSGRMPAGRYQWTMTYLRRDGQESGGSRAEVLEAASGGLAFTNLPVSGDAAVTHKAVYLTRPNGKTLYRALVVPNADTSAAYTGDTLDLGAALETQFKQHPPAPTCMAEHNGRMLIGVDRFLLYSDPYQPERFDPRRQAYQFTDGVTNIAPVRGGVFVGTFGEVAFLSGEDIASASYDRRAAYGCLPGALAWAHAIETRQQTTDQVGLLVTEMGLCALTSGGGFTNLTHDRYVYPRAVAAATTVRRRDGMNQLIGVLRGT